MSVVDNGLLTLIICVRVTGSHGHWPQEPRSPAVSVLRVPGTCTAWDRVETGKYKAHSRTTFSPLQLLIGHGLYSWEQKYGRVFCCVIFFLTYLEGFIPQVLFFFSNHALTSVFGKMCYFWSIHMSDFYFATQPVLLWIVLLLVLVHAVLRSISRRIYQAAEVI